MHQYLFKSERLGFRTWTEQDIVKMSAINSNPNVMEFFPSTKSFEQTSKFIDYMNTHFEEHGFCYFAVDRLDNHNFIGFIGLLNQTFEADFTPCIDIGWRIAEKEWGNGFATEGALKCLDYAFNVIGLENIVAVCPTINNRSENVMQKIGMKKVSEFKHPLLSTSKHLENCVFYRINQNDFKS